MVLRLQWLGSVFQTQCRASHTEQALRVEALGGMSKVAQSKCQAEAQRRAEGTGCRHCTLGEG